MVPVEVCMIVCLSGTCVVSVTSKLYLAIRTWGISATCLTVLLQIRYCYFFSFLFFMWQAIILIFSIFYTLLSRKLFCSLTIFHHTFSDWFCVVLDWGSYLFYCVVKFYTY